MDIVRARVAPPEHLAARRAASAALLATLRALIDDVERLQLQAEIER